MNNLTATYSYNKLQRLYAAALDQNSEITATGKSVNKLKDNLWKEIVKTEKDPFYLKMKRA